MEANFFRCFAAALADALAGRRIEKIFNPAPEVWTFKVQTHGGSAFLLLRLSPKEGLIFLTPHKPENPQEPSALCMWLRKRLANRRMGDARWDWPSRRIALPLSPGEEEGWLILSLREAPALVDDLPEGFGDEPSWPDADRAVADPEVWRDHPQMTPSLRRLLAASPPGRAQAILDAVRRGGCGAFFVYTGKDGVAKEALAWRLPEDLRGGMEEHAFDDPLAAAEMLGLSSLFPHLAALAEADARERLKAEGKRIKRARGHLERDRERLTAMADGAHDGEALRGMLYLFDKDEKRPYVDAPCEDGTTRRIELDPRLTVKENMERLFRLAAKGRRGLEFVAGRERELDRKRDALDRGELPKDARPRPEKISERRRVKRSTGDVPGTTRFVTSDGFTVLRGRNAKANHALVTKVASPFDLWFHADGGPGAHVVLRRDYPDQDVPERSLVQAATLAAAKSHAAGSNAEVMYAQAKYVRPVKGGGPGKVTVDRREGTIAVSPAPELEDELSAEGR